jgi:hypothetical protein
MACEAGIIDFRDAYSEEHVQAVLQDLKAFEALVRADERKCAVRNEREACAQLCENQWQTAHEIQDAIRNRGNT